MNSSPTQKTQFSSLWSLIISGILFFPILIWQNDWAGWLLLYFTFLVLLFPRKIRRDRGLAVAASVTLIAHHVVALVNVYVGTVIGADLDAATFHQTASELAKAQDVNWYFQIDGYFYQQFLGLFYRIFGASLLFGQELSILAYTLSCIVLVKLISQLGLWRFRVGLIILYGLFPSVAILGSLTLRESWQMLFFLLSVCCAFKLRQRLSFRNIGLLILSSLALGLLHHGLAAYAIIFIILSLFWGSRILRKKGGFDRLIVGLAVAGVAILAYDTIAGNLIGASTALVSGNKLEYAETFRLQASTIEGRATYGINLDTSSLGRLMASCFLIFIYYLFAPFPWQVTSVLDIYAMLESLLRFFLLYFAFVSWLKSRGETKSQYGFLLVSFLSMEFLWALGTVNWGTAIRHHLVAYGILVLLGGSGILKRISKLLARNSEFVSKPNQKVIL